MLLTLKETAELYALITISKQGLPYFKWCESATFESTARYIANQTEIHKSFGVFTHDLKLAGVASFHKYVEHLSLGYWLGTPFRGQGLMCRSVDLLLRHIENFFPGTKEVRVKIHDSNKKSLKVAEYCGFKRDGAVSTQEHDWIRLSWKKI